MLRSPFTADDRRPALRRRRPPPPRRLPSPRLAVKPELEEALAWRSCRSRPQRRRRRPPDHRRRALTRRRRRAAAARAACAAAPPRQRVRYDGGAAVARAIASSRSHPRAEVQQGSADDDRGSRAARQLATRDPDGGIWRSVAVGTARPGGDGHRGRCRRARRRRRCGLERCSSIARSPVDPLEFLARGRGGRTASDGSGCTAVERGVGERVAVVDKHRRRDGAVTAAVSLRSS